MIFTDLSLRIVSAPHLARILTAFRAVKVRAAVAYGFEVSNRLDI